MAELREGVQRITETPLAYPVVSGGIRRYLLKRFRYAIIYEPTGDHLMIWAVMHLHRDPNYWKNRLR